MACPQRINEFAHKGMFLFTGPVHTLLMLPVEQVDLRQISQFSHLSETHIEVKVFDPLIAVPVSSHLLQG